MSAVGHNCAVNISAKADYAMRALLLLAVDETGKPVKGQHLATTQGIPLKFLENILTELRVGFALLEYTATRGWSTEAMDAAIARLRDRGLLDGDALSAEGRRVRDGIEDATDRAQQPVVDAQPGVDHRGSLQRLDGRAPEHGNVDIAGTPDDGAVRAERDGGAVVDALVDAAARRRRHRHVGGHWCTLTRCDVFRAGVGAPLTEDRA